MREYVALLKADGAPAEQVVIQIKEAISQAGLQKGGKTIDPFIDGVVTFCIKQYYRGV